MLVLARRVGQKIKIGEDVEIVVLKLHGDIVKLGIAAPRECRVLRSEIQEGDSQCQTNERRLSND